MRIGALHQGGNTCSFRVFAPYARSLEVVLPQRGGSHPMEKRERGYWEARLESVPVGTVYGYRIDGGEVRPDPASHCSAR